MMIPRKTTNEKGLHRRRRRPIQNNPQLYHAVIVQFRLAPTTTTTTRRSSHPIKSKEQQQHLLPSTNRQQKGRFKTAVQWFPQNRLPSKGLLRFNRKRLKRKSRLLSFIIITKFLLWRDSFLPEKRAVSQTLHLTKPCITIRMTILVRRTPR